MLSWMRLVSCRSSGGVFFLERTAAILRLRGRFTDADVHDVTALALCGLVRTGAAFDFEMKYWPDQSR